MAGVITTTKQAPKTDYQRHWMFADSDDKAMLKQIEETHFPDSREFDVKPIIQIIEDILRRATLSFDGVPKGTEEHVDRVEDNILLDEFDLLFEQLAHVLHKISCEISCKLFSGGGDAHTTIMTLLHTLSIYSWDAKLVLTMAAFAVNYGEFSLISQLRSTNLLAKSVAFLKQLPDIKQHSKSLKPHFEALSKLIEVIIDVTKCIVEIKELPSQYISDDKPPLSSAKSYIPSTAYWTIRGILGCSTQIASLIGYTVSSTEAWELSSLVHQINARHQQLKDLLTLCHQQIDEKMRQEKIGILIRITKTPQLDNMKILKELLYPSEELVIGTTKKKVNIEVLRRKHVILLISGLEIHQDEIIILSHYQAELADPLVRQGQEMHYEMLWLPIVDNVAKDQYSPEENRRDFERLQAMMIWYTVLDPFAIEPAVIEFVKNIWHFEKRPIAVSLDPQGRVASENALPMMWIWGNLPFPFSKEREEALWKSAYATWRLELLVDSTDPRIIDCKTKENTFICLYGGDDIEWIRKFTIEAKAVAKNAQITLELFYVGKSHVARERMRKITEIIAKDQLSDCWTGKELTYQWYFWVRLESMLYSKLQSNKTAENDAVMKELTTVYSFNGGEQGWAVVCRSLSTDEMATGNGEIVLKSLQEFEKWKEEAANNRFVQALREYMEKLHTPEHCTRLILPGTTSTWGLPPDTKVVCAVCLRPMERYLLYRCCTD
ncbi:hypothetical protein I3760_12G032800 [Carya illinoinensis]|nr:hypothetical protein I3760_12G032800 [Carya illinoinensis]